MQNTDFSNYSLEKLIEHLGRDTATSALRTTATQRQKEKNKRESFALLNANPELKKQMEALIAKAKGATK